MLRCQNTRAQFWLICSTNTEKIPLKLDIKRRVTAAKNNTRFRLLKKVLAVFVTQSRAKLSKHKFTWIHSNQTFCYSRDEKHTSFSLVTWRTRETVKMFQSIWITLTLSASLYWTLQHPWIIHFRITDSLVFNVEASTFALWQPDGTTGFLKPHVAIFGQESNKWKRDRVVIQSGDFTYNSVTINLKVLSLLAKQCGEK